MRSEGTRGPMDGVRDAAAAARAWLRRVMPRVAIAAAVAVAVRLLFDEFALPGAAAVRALYRLAAPVVYLTVAYYGLKGLLWLKRRLLWRVRRRLVITYLFVGLTPIVLLAALAGLVGLVGLNQVATRVVKVQLAAQETQAHTSARMLAESLARIPADNRAAQTWLDERVALLQASLPGARAAVWRSAAGAGQGEGDTSRPAQLVSEPEDERTRGVGGDETPLGSPLPAWLGGRAEWRGLAFVAPPADDAEAFGSPSLRALARARSQSGREVTVLLAVPVSRAFVERLREDTGLAVRPFFVGAEGAEVRINRTRLGTSYASIGDVGAQRRDPENPDGAYIVEGARVVRLDFRRDQFGDAVGPKPPVILPATNWKDGAESLRAAFICDFDAWLVASQLVGEGGVGQVLQGTITFVAVVFLVLELLALLSAAWMTRAVTASVHRLHRATEFIKRGDFSHRVRLRSRDQLGELGAAFNEMSADIEQLLAERVERERLEREVEIAAEVQAQLFPREVPELAGAEVAGECRAARGVAGDYYDYVEVTPGLFAVALGDVSGKGISAALVMSNLQAALRAQTTVLAERLKLARRVAAATASVPAGPAGGPDDRSALDLSCDAVGGPDEECAVEQMAASINRQLCRSTDSNRFATVFLALYEEGTRRLRYVNAGHNAPLLVRAGGAVERPDVGGTVLGAFDWAAYEESAATFGRGDLLLIFSDGITEAQNAAGEEYGDDRLTEFARANRRLSADELRRAVFREIELWSGEQERGDDQTVVILKVDE